MEQEPKLIGNSSWPFFETEMQRCDPSLSAVEGKGESGKGRIGERKCRVEFETGCMPTKYDGWW